MAKRAGGGRPSRMDMRREAESQGDSERDTSNGFPHDDTFGTVHLTVISGAVVGRFPPAPFCPSFDQRSCHAVSDTCSLDFDPIA